MSAIKPDPPPAVTGVVFGRSVPKMVGFILFNVLAFVFGVCLIWAKVTDHVIEPESNPQQVSWWGLVVGIAAVLAAPCAIVGLVRAVRHRRRVVVAPDRLQVVETVGGVDVVLLQIPYANIAEIQYEATSTKRRVGIDLRWLDDPDTYAKSEKFEQNKKVQGRHFCIVSGYEGGPRAIAAEIERALARFSGR